MMAAGQSVEQGVGDTAVVFRVHRHRGDARGYHHIQDGLFQLLGILSCRRVGQRLFRIPDDRAKTEPPCHDTQFTAII